MTCSDGGYRRAREQEQNPRKMATRTTLHAPQPGQNRHIFENKIEDTYDTSFGILMNWDLHVGVISGGGGLVVEREIIFHQYSRNLQQNVIVTDALHRMPAWALPPSWSTCPAVKR
jgi:hypothetical protein